MSRLYDTVEPSPIDEEMLMQAVAEQGPKETAGRIAKAEGYDFRDVRFLRLDFKNILKIGGLWEFVNLTKLQLDNNIIEKIEGIDLLVNLVWLDLSFNNIEVIEGLDTLTKLEDLSLFNNHISRMENMDTLINLHVFSIGNNSLQELDNVIYLRMFKKLRTLNLSNNPLCENENYKVFIGAFLPHLEFLDYRLLDDQTRADGHERFYIQVEQLLEKERKACAKELEAETVAKELDRHKRAFVEHLNEPLLFQTMFAADTEGKLLKEMPGVDEAYVQYGDKLTAISQQIFDFGMEEFEKREAEVALFWECVSEAKAETKETSVKAVDDFLARKKVIFAELSHTADTSLLDLKVGEYHAVVTELWDTLMGLEMHLVDQLEEVVQTFDLNLQEMLSAFIENLQALLAQAREAENDYNDKVLESAQVTLDLVLRNEAEDEIPDDLRWLCIDKDTVTSAVATSHDAHLLTIDNKEDDIVSRINSWKQSMMQKIHEEEEFNRNRARVTEINHLIDHFRDEIDGLEMECKLHY